MLKIVILHKDFYEIFFEFLQVNFDKIYEDFVVILNLKIAKTYCLQLKAQITYEVIEAKSINKTCL